MELTPCHHTPVTSLPSKFRRHDQSSDGLQGWMPYVGMCGSPCIPGGINPKLNGSHPKTESAPEEASLTWVPVRVVALA